MKKALGALVMVTGLVVVAGCARSERWTLDGSKPGPLDDRKGARTEAHMPKPADNPGQAVPTRSTELVMENDNAIVRNKSDVSVAVTVQVTPANKNMPREAAHEIQVLVPAKSDARAGRINGAGEEAWSYRIVRVESR